jgi:release factor glutamine methyltransferase
VEGLEISVFPGIFHPRYFGSTSILARFVSSLSLRDKSLLEIGCGSGVVALCAARGGAKVTAVDINPDAVRCTIVNAKRNDLCVTVRQSDLFSSLAASKFDVIAWNPPFLPAVPKSMAEAAFYGGNDFDVIRRCVGEAREHLHTGGAIYTILSSDIAVEQIEQLFRNEDFTVSRVLSRRWGLGERMLILCAQMGGHRPPLQ